MGEKDKPSRRARGPGLTYHQVMKAGREARRRSDKDEFVYLPPGITYYRTLRPGGPTTYGCSMKVRDRTLPDDGWRHAQPCDCEFCRVQR
jgi:hypothetical protein